MKQEAERLIAAVVAGLVGIGPARAELSPETMNGTDISGAKIINPVTGAAPTIPLKTWLISPTAQTISVIPPTSTVVATDMNQISGGSLYLPLATVAGLQPGMLATGAGLPAANTVSAILGAGQLSQAANGSFSSGQAVISLSSVSGYVAGMQCIDTTTPTAIADGNRINSVGASSITLNSNIAVNSGGTADTIVCDPVVVLASATTKTVLSGANISFTNVVTLGSTGTGGIVNASTYEIGGTPVLQLPFPGTGTQPLVIGPGAAAGLSPTAIFDTVIGNLAGGSGGAGLTGVEDTFVGIKSGYMATTGSYDTGVGVYSQQAITTGSQNTSVGEDSMRNQTTPSGSVAMGANADRNSMGSFNVAIGFNALDGQEGANGTSLTTGGSNVAVGYNAMLGAALTTGSNDIGVGPNSLIGVTTGSNNIGIGLNALQNLTVGAGSVAIGANAGSPGVIGGNNVYIGTSAASGATTSGNNNVVVGALAATGLTGGGKNVIVGELAGTSVTSGAQNVILGYDVGVTTLTTGSNNVLIGTTSNVDTVAAGTTNEVNIAGLFFLNSTSLTAPAVTNCGTGGTVDAHANNHTGQIQVGTGTIAGCTLTFAGSYASWVHCVVSSETTEAAFAYVLTTGSITISATSLTSDKIDYSCEGY